LVTYSDAYPGSSNFPPVRMLDIYKDVKEQMGVPGVNPAGLLDLSKISTAQQANASDRGT